MAEFSKPLVDPDKTLKEGIFGITEVETKTELNSVQIEAVNKLKTLSVFFGNELLDQHLEYFMRIQKSKDRKGLAEFVDAFKSKKTDLIEKAKGMALLG